MHDLGMTVGRQDHELYSGTIALPIIDRILKQVLKDDLERRVKIRSLAMEGIVGHMGAHKIHSLEEYKQKLLVHIVMEKVKLLKTNVQHAMEKEELELQVN